MHEPADPTAATSLTRAVVEEVPDRLRDLHTRHREVLRWYDGPPQASADTLLEDLRQVGTDLAFNVRSLGMTEQGSGPPPPRFVDLHGGEDLTVAQVCEVLATSAEQSVRQAIARIQECITLEQVDQVLQGLVSHGVEQVQTVRVLLADPAAPGRDSSCADS